MKFPLPWRRHNNRQHAPTSLESSNNSLEEAGQLLREQRERKGLSIRDLSKEVRITTPVLEALERGWQDRLPEAAYLVAMLQRLETYLDLPSNSLSAALLNRPGSNRLETNGRSTRFTLGSIDIFTTWQGSVVYGAVMIGSILALNHQQRHLINLNAFSPKPIPINTPLDSDQILKGLRPLEEELTASLGQVDLPLDQPTRPGVLEINLNQPRQISLSSEGGDRTNLQGATGTVTLQLLPPVDLSINPPPGEADSVRWNGQALTPKTNQPGSYHLSQAAALSP
ncbi:helix-turn-helix domain-containing protein [Synechococcus sp. SYN20]|uniref:helix-turn-helix domain-containing protein n=1 Tax=Synechococcus sp. SYN20 TaxID=1050714 RepID=UPI0016450D7E|nr:helix-turn-helix domain-containing protein [Synechococcus sp. SYN20]QNJ25554.1 helix-turn-helix domain-containing protein [Synechococcus sp. SYN20]